MSAAIDPAGRFLYVSNAGDGTVSEFSINNATGALTAVPGSPASTGAGSSSSPTGIVVDHSSQFVYVANGSEATITSFLINQSTGDLGIGTKRPAGAAGGADSSYVAVY